jgi:hypothetical protein
MVCFKKTISTNTYDPFGVDSLFLFFYKHWNPSGSLSHHLNYLFQS